MPGRHNEFERRLVWRTVRAVALLVALGCGGCGYHVAGRAANLPSDWKTVAIPAFKNDTTAYRVEERFTQAVIREFITRTNYRVVQDKDSADGVLTGEVISIEANPATFEATTGQVTTMLVSVHAKVQLVDNQTQKVVYKNDDMVFRGEYQISSNVTNFFDEEDPALERMSHDLASHLVADVLEGF